MQNILASVILPVVLFFFFVTYKCSCIILSMSIFFCFLTFLCRLGSCFISGCHSKVRAISRVWCINRSRKLNVTSQRLSVTTAVYTSMRMGNKPFKITQFQAIRCLADSCHQRLTLQESVAFYLYFDNRPKLLSRIELEWVWGKVNTSISSRFNTPRNSLSLMNRSVIHN